LSDSQDANLPFSNKLPVICWINLPENFANDHRHNIDQHQLGVEFENFGELGLIDRSSNTQVFPFIIIGIHGGVMFPIDISSVQLCFFFQIA
jgi:hypothetical protein